MQWTSGHLDLTLWSGETGEERKEEDEEEDAGGDEGAEDVLSTVLHNVLKDKQVHREEMQSNDKHWRSL